MVYTFIESFSITKDLETDLLELSTEFFNKLAAIKAKYKVPSIQIMNDYDYGLSYNICDRADSITDFLNTHPPLE